MRTSDIIFSPYVDASEEFGAFGKKVQDWAANLRALIDELSRKPEQGGKDPKSVKPDQIAFQGHAGALYDKADAKGGRTKAQGEWHDELRKRFQTAGSVNEAVASMQTFAQKTVWDGKFDPQLTADTLVQVKVDLKGSDGNRLEIDHIDGKTTASKERAKALRGVDDEIQAEVGMLGKEIETLLGLSERQKVAAARVQQDFVEAQKKVNDHE